MTDGEMQSFINHGYMLLLAVMCFVAVTGAIWIRIREHSRENSHLQQVQSKLTGLEGPLTKSETRAIEMPIDTANASRTMRHEDADLAKEYAKSVTT